MTVVLFRIDERLIHGQVVIGWGTQLRPHSYIVVDDELADSDWEQDLYRLGLPDGVEGEFLSVSECRQRLPALREGDSPIVILTRKVEAMLGRRYPSLKPEYVEAISRLAVEVNASFEAQDSAVRVETPLSLRSILDRVPTGLMVYADRDDPLRMAWEEYVLPQVDVFDRDHYETVWNAVVRKGPVARPF